MSGDYNAVTLTMPYLKVLLMVWFRKILELIFHRQQSHPKKNTCCTLKKTNLIPFPEIFLYF